MPRKPRPANDDQIGRLVLLLVAGVAPDQAARAGREQFGLTPAGAREAVKEARRRLQLAAEYNRDEALGTAIQRLNTLYAAAVQEKDTRSAIAAQKEINRLLDLTRTADADAIAGGDGEAAAILAAVVAHLAPLDLAADDTPPDELARLAVAEILKLKGRNVRHVDP